MKLVIISDTHGTHNDVDVPKGDVLIHCGDFCGQSSKLSAARFAHWFDQQPHQYKLVIAGNHDRYADETLFLCPRVKYLQDSGVTIQGVNFYGSPWTPTFFDWYFMKDRGPEIAERWSEIPPTTDVLITHGPPAFCGSLGKTEAGEDVGCVDLSDHLFRVLPNLHCFGHIHSGYGIGAFNGLTFVNASICDERYLPVNAPVVVEI